MEATLADQFATIVGEPYALRAAEDIRPFITDPRGLYSGTSELVLRPGTVDEVSRIMRLAFETSTPIVPQAGSTGVVGGQLPRRTGGEVVVSTGRLNRVREIDILSKTLTVEAGVILENVQRIADEADCLFPLTLGAQGSCQIGGNLATNAGGTGVLAYGNARDLCLGLEVVLPSGEIFDDLSKLKKDNTGYDLKNLFIGAEGTLGIITAAVLRLYPKPKGRDTAWVAIASPEAAIQLFSRASDRAGSALTAFELIGRMPLEFAVRHIHGTVDPFGQTYPWYVLMETSSGRSRDDSRQLMEAILEEGLEIGLVEDAVIASSIAQEKAFWLVRESFSDAQKPEGGSIKHDISIPVASIPEFILTATAAVEKLCHGVRVVCFGHMGDGNLHFSVSQPEGMDKAAFVALYGVMNKTVHDIVRAMNGSISAEHGIGQLKRDELLATTPRVAIDLMQTIKRTLDPKNIMNPGKVI